MVMHLSCMFKELALIVVKLTIVVTSVAAQAKPGCQSRCGNISIPYPFGIGSVDCSISSDFLIRCENKTSSPPKAFLKTNNDTDNIEVLSISMDGYMRINSTVGYDCYNNSARTGMKNIDMPIQFSNFTLSHARNRFIAIGCDTYAFLRDNATNNISTGCSTSCSDVADVIGGYCSGIGCCQTAIPKAKGVRRYSISFSSDHSHSRVLTFNPCSYAFVVEYGAYNFSVSDLNAPDFRNKQFPIIVNWTIGNQTCQKAQKDPNYSCKQNSDCEVSKNNGSGYLCKCRDGFQGNPYLSPGCTDIDECKTLKPCNQTCKNLPGSYKCSCLKGFYGDGWKNGTGCSRKPKPNKKLPIIVGFIASIGTVAMQYGIWKTYKELKTRKNIKLKRKNFERNGGSLLQEQLSNNEGDAENIKLFGSSELEEATDDYSDNRSLGQGGLKTVYRGMLKDGRIVAIRKCKNIAEKIVDEKKRKQFINNMIRLSQVNQRNVVKLLGCCLEAEVPSLVYEFIPNETLSELSDEQFIPNGTLSELLDEQDPEFPITWKMRLRIAIEVAQVLSDTHSSATSAPIYHGNIKSSDIMLDDKYRAKVLDFGTLRSTVVEQTHLTTQVQGTSEYLDPKYSRSNQFTEKSDDVYSFGVVLVELLTGRKPISSKQSEDVKSLVTTFLLKIKDNSLDDILDPMILNDGSHEKIVAVANLAKRCLNPNGKRRPTMKRVAMELKRIRGSKEANDDQQVDDEATDDQQGDDGANDIEDEIDPSNIASFSNI